MYNRDVSISCVVLEIRLGSLEGFMKKLAEEISQKTKKTVNPPVMMNSDNAIQCNDSDFPPSPLPLLSLYICVSNIYKLFNSSQLSSPCRDC